MFQVKKQVGELVAMPLGLDRQCRSQLAELE